MANMFNAAAVRLSFHRCAANDDDANANAVTICSHASSAKWIDLVQQLDSSSAWRIRGMEQGAHMSPWLYVGSELPLGDALEPWLPKLERDDAGVYHIHEQKTGKADDPYPESARLVYAQGAFQASLTWPPWSKDEVDPINLQPFSAEPDISLKDAALAGGINAYVDRAADDYNGLSNLVGLRRGNVTKFMNMSQLELWSTSVYAKDVHPRDPLFHASIHDFAAFEEIRSFILSSRDVQAMHGVQLEALLPIIDLDTNEWISSYGRAFKGVKASN